MNISPAATAFYKIIPLLNPVLKKIAGLPL